ncbi:class I SAM-dependent methyltransferase [Nguyenibacter vanlangensis]|uniref:Ubiquinone/menaquinone biosynthesis C-methyltransferase UbiE n=1 Tax=Nguyenibacter vanlangensis TaxID=1216886 RepID=A0A7Y7M663_9PROT|nr:class I SAM-dependent methyltransferase [Nguyenibacter vanlangensis]NVN10361.1 class I SAM-dependent methyltransferase [Nguyenibacter vanlangensis]
MPETSPSPPHPVLTGYYRTEGDRVAFVRSIFDRTARYYDRINAIFSLGTGGWYRRRILRRAGLVAGQSLLDVATGTGLVAREAARITGAGNVVGLDMSPGMLAACRQRLPIGLVLADAQHLPVPDAGVDMLSMGYALRHVDDLAATFAEYRRVIRPGGALLILEIGRAHSPMAQSLMRFYLGQIVPFLSGVAASRDSRTLMHYYWETIEECVSPDRILTRLREAGFTNVRKETNFGVFHAYMAQCPLDAALP